MSALGLGLAIGGLGAWGAGLWARHSKLAAESRALVQGETALEKYVAESLELGSLVEIVQAADATARTIFGVQRTVAFEPGAAAGSWDAWVVSGGEATSLTPIGESTPRTSAVPDGLKGVFGWFRHNPGVVDLSQLANPRYGALRSPLQDLRTRYGVSILVPLVDRSRTLGALAFSLPRVPGRIERELFEHLRTDVTAAAANVRLHHEAARALSLEKEMDLASAVQVALAPESPVGEIQGLSWAGRHQAAGQAGSDFWNVYPLGEGRALFVIGDVVGQGLAGSMASAMAKGCCDSLNADLATLDAGQLLTALNRALYRPHRPLHMTCFAAIFDPGTGTVSHANAGQPMPYRMVGQKLSVLGRGGKILGDGPASLYRAVTEPMAQGETFLLYSDGIVDGMNLERQPFGERRLQRALLAARDRSPADIVQHVVSELEHFRGPAPRYDDEVLVVVKAA